MRNRRDDLRNIALILGAGAVGVFGTVLVTQASKGPGREADRTEARLQAVLEAREMVITGTAARSEQGVTVRIRGSQDAEGGLRAEPIIYIDGVRVDRPRDEAMKLLDPDQIDRIEVVKGPAARQKYGSEARDGVIQIFTKSSEETSKEEDGSGR